MDKKFFNGLLIGSVLTMIITLGVVTVTQNLAIVDLKAWNRLNRVTALIESKYYGEYTDEDIIEGVLQGACFNLDKYSAFLTVEDYEDAVDPDQEFGGIGVNVTFNKYTKVFRINQIYDNTPASKVGLMRNDIIEAVDGYDMYDVDMDKLTELLRGAPGSTVSLKVNRDGEELDFDIVREHVVMPYAVGYSIDEQIGYVRLTSFNGTVAEDFREALKSLGPVKGVVLDLRGNGGGATDCYKEVMEQLVPSCVLQTVTYKNGHTETLDAVSNLTAPAYKIVVLVNDGTASCAEAMTQALVDLTGSKVVGTETYGKGVVQEYFSVDDKAVVRLTTGVVSSPSGVVWNEVGITPDVVVEYEYLGEDFAETDLIYDSQVRAGYDILVSELG